MNRLQSLQLPSLFTRFAPTPSGYLHIGNVYSFLITWLVARKNAGRILLRIDDLDKERVRQEYVDDIFRVLEWLGLDWDAGPASSDDFHRHFSQSHRSGIYMAMLEELREKRLVFACSCSRRQLKEHASGAGYPGYCKDRQIGLMESDVLWRLDTAQHLILKPIEFGSGPKNAMLPDSQSHFVVRRRDGLPAYHLASVADDLHFGINFVVRGQDLAESTLAQLYLATTLEATAFLNTTFFHHPLILNNRTKLSKSQQASPVFKEYYPDKKKLFRQLGAWLGLQPDQSNSLEELLLHFSPKVFAGFSAQAR